MNAVADLRAGVALLTRVPVGRARVEGSGLAAFGLVGAAIGLVAAVPILLAGPVAPLAAAGLALATTALVSGGLHLDGLADTFDALAAPNAEAAEAARRDPRAGPAGVAAILLVLAVEAGALAAVVERDVAAAGLLAVAAGSVSRTVAGVAGAVLRMRPVGGSGAWFGGRATARAAAFAVASTVLVVGLVAVGGARPGIALGAAAGAAAGIGLAAWLVRVRRGLDGDALGAIAELTTAAVLFAGAVVA
jgi:adenosylcobinamide-GDP ribazoletransferase